MNLNDDADDLYEEEKKQNVSSIDELISSHGITEEQEEQIQNQNQNQNAKSASKCK